MNQILKKLLKEYILYVWIAVGIIVVGLALWLFLPTQSGITPGSKVMAATIAYLMEQERQLEENSQFDNPRLCNCCDAVISPGGICPICKNDCDQGEGERRKPPRQDIPTNEVEVGDDPGSNGGNCSGH